MLYDEEGKALLHGEIEHAHNVGMGETRQQLGFAHKVGCILLAEPGVQDFEGSLTLEIDMLPQVDLGEAAPAQQAQQAVISELFADTIYHYFFSHHHLPTDR